MKNGIDLKKLMRPRLRFRIFRPNQTFMAKSFFWTTPDGLNIHAKDWRIENAKAVILIVHGMGEHCGRYNEVAEFYNKNGLGVLGYDRRGHGLSEGKRGHVPNSQTYFDELSTMLQQAEKLYPGKPIFLYGHSMGGNTVLNFVLNNKPKISGVIATGSWITLFKNPSALRVVLARWVNHIYPAFSQNTGLNPAHISSVAAEVERYKNDPLIHNKITTNTGLTILEAAEFLNNYNGEFPVPALIMHGAADQITSPAGSRNFANRVKGKITYKEWDGMYHEIHHEKNRTQVFEFTLRWIDAVIG